MAVRFRPPRVPVSRELEWVLLRGFGPVETSFDARGFAAAEAHALARRLWLASRLAHRHPRRRLEAELGAVAERFRHDLAAAVAMDLRLALLAEEVAAAAAERGLPLVFLKYMALRRSGVLEAGCRGADDVDVLVAPERAPQLAAELVRRGWAPHGEEMEHQLAPLHHPRGGMVEVHRRILGVRVVAGKASATVADLEGAGLLVAVEGLPGACAVPRREILAAHALVHGIAQHGLAPRAYPALRMVADLLDLGLGGAGGGDLARRLAPWVEREVHPTEVVAAAGLCRSLASGDTSLLAAAPASGEAALLHHLLAGALDADYGRSLRLRDLAHPLSDRPRLVSTAAAVARAAFPGRHELDAIYGEPATRLGRLARRLARPLDLLARAFGSARSRVRLRRRGR